MIQADQGEYTLPFALLNRIRRIIVVFQFRPFCSESTQLYQVNLYLFSSFSPVLISGGIKLIPNSV